MTADPRRAGAAFTLTGVDGAAQQQGHAEAVIGDDALIVGPVTASFLDADALRAADYRIELDLWPAGRLVLTELGRRFDTFAKELRGARNQARVAGLLAHGITAPEVFIGALLHGRDARPAEFQLYDTHVAVVPDDGDPWQVPLGALTTVRRQEDPPAVVLEASSDPTYLGHLGRKRDACHGAILERLEAQRSLLASLTGQGGFSDGWGVPRAAARDFEQMIERFSAPNRSPCAACLLALATAEPRLGFVQLLDPDTQTFGSPSELPERWAMFLLAPVGPLTVLEILAGPSAATYVFRDDVESVNRHLQTLHFRRAPLALTPDEAVVTPGNPHRLALRKLAPLQRLRACTVARVVHNDAWEESLRRAIA
ncbi:MAG TPA: hypothetical protein VNL18_00540 [Gemmatimonadales bacterium]|nr:hypothetical protein [Gemmatimonadales bacterium]